MSARVRATAPGKLMLAGEYAVLSGGPAIMTACDRRVIATARATSDGGGSPFLDAAARVIASARGDGAAARAARAVAVDSSALFEGADKLGLGSSAAATVAAVAFALAHEDDAPDRDEIHRLAAAAHGDAQALRGARGSGADVAASTYGGALVFHAGAPVRPFALPADLLIVPFWTGAPADTATLVPDVLRAAPPAALAAIAAAAAALADARDAAAAIAAFDRGADALAALGRAASIDLLTAPVRRLRDALRAQGGACKTCGAGAGDVAVAALPAGADVTATRAAILQAGCRPLGISVGAPGVEILR